MNLTGTYRLTAYFTRNIRTSRFIQNPMFIQPNVIRFTELGLFYDDEPNLHPEPIYGVIIAGCPMELEPYEVK